MQPKWQLVLLPSEQGRSAGEWLEGLVLGFLQLLMHCSYCQEHVFTVC